MSTSLEPSFDLSPRTTASSIELVLVFRRLQEQHDNILSMLELARAEEFTRATVWPQIRHDLISHERAEFARVFRMLSDDADLQAMVGSHEADVDRINLLVSRLDGCDILSEGWDELVEDLLEACRTHFSAEEVAIFPKAQQHLGIEASPDYEQLSLDDFDDVTREFPRQEPGVVASALGWIRDHPSFGISILFGIGLAAGLLRRRHLGFGTLARR